MECWGPGNRCRVSSGGQEMRETRVQVEGPLWRREIFSPLVGEGKGKKFMIY